MVIEFDCSHTDPIVLTASNGHYASLEATRINTSISRIILSPSKLERTLDAGSRPSTQLCIDHLTHQTGVSSVRSSRSKTWTHDRCGKILQEGSR